MKMEEDTNKGLYDLQNAWYENLKNSDYQNTSIFSSPFCFGISKETIEKCNGKDGKDLLMYVGEEAKGWRFKRCKDLEYIQNFAIAYFDNQISDSPLSNERINYFDEGDDRAAVQKKNNSPFWSFLRELKGQTDCEVCWNNLDKLHRITQNGKTKPLTCKQEEKLHEKFNCSDESLLLQEINRVRPEFILFMGAGYKRSIEVALSKKISEEMIPDADTLGKIIPCSDTFDYKPKGIFWICHPGWLQWKGKKKKDNILNNLVNQINKLKK